MWHRLLFFLMKLLGMFYSACIEGKEKLWEIRTWTLFGEGKEISLAGLITGCKVEERPCQSIEAKSLETCSVLLAFILPLFHWANFFTHPEHHFSKDCFWTLFILLNYFLDIQKFRTSGSLWICIPLWKPWHLALGIREIEIKCLQPLKNIYIIYGFPEFVYGI